METTEPSSVLHQFEQAQSLLLGIERDTRSLDFASKHHLLNRVETQLLPLLESLRACCRNGGVEGSQSRAPRLETADFPRYGRQMIMPLVGRAGQERLSSGSVLVVGAGGTGSPVLQYLAAMGIGKIGVMDADVVELSNLHRQVIHSEAAVGSKKTHSAARSMKRINSRVTIQTHDAMITPQNALAIAAEYDVLIDCTDSLPSHYLLSDVSVLQRKPLVSASALQTYAQLYTFIPGRLTPCYRCLYPLTNHSSAPAPRSCSDAGVLGVVPGIVGSLAALEATKLLLKLPDDDDTLCGRLLLFDATDGARMFKTVALRSRRPDCAVCGDSPSVLPPLQSHHYDLPVACAVMFDPLPPHVELSPREYLEMKEKQASHLLIDARVPVQFQICALPNAINVPLPQLLPYLSASRLDPETPIVFVCRRGISSRQALVSSIRAFPHHPFFHIRGGLEAYAATCDPLFPRY